MTHSFTHLSDVFRIDYDTVIDVRSPDEFAEDHMPGAINLPVLDNQERARVGTIYKQQSPFSARKIGAALVFRNAAQHIERQLAHYPGKWRPLIYCWRGGQRSGSFCWMLREIGWRADTVQGGYRSYRRLVSEHLYKTPFASPVIQLGGYTGTAKTALLPLLAERGLQILDLEGLARHRGSLLGHMPGGQPSQKAFESALARAIMHLDSQQPVIVEAESSKIGQINLPPSLWDAMKAAPWIEISAPIEARARYLARAYDDILSDHAGLVDALSPLRAHRGHAVVDHWQTLSQTGQRLELCTSLAVDHYDPAYKTSQKTRQPNVIARLHAEDLAPDNLHQLADQIVERVQTTSI